MQIATFDTACDRSAESGKRELAATAQFILSALESADLHSVERRRGSRLRYRVEATLSLFIDGPEDAPRVVYTRDLTPHHLGFISPVSMPLGVGGTLRLPASNGQVDTIDCNVIRCQEIIHGWFDCSVSFTEDMSPDFQVPRATDYHA